MTEPGFIPPPVPGWWVKKNNATIPPIAEVKITGHQPRVTVGPTAKPHFGTLLLTGHQPRVTTGPTLQPDTGELTLTGHAPRLQTTVHPDSGLALTLIAFAPSVGWIDDFNRADGALGSAGDGWTNKAGSTMSVENNQARPSSEIIENFSLLDTPMSVDDFKVTIVVGTKIGNGSDQLFIVCGSNTSGECTTVSFTQGTFSIQSRDAFGIGASNQASALINFNLGDELSCERIGAVYRVRKNGTSLGTWTDSLSLTPRDSSHRLVGIGGFRSAGTYRRIDSFKAENL